MSLAVHKWPVTKIGANVLNMPMGSEVLHFGVDPMGVTCLWALVAPESPKIPRTFHLVPTGRTIVTQRMQYVGTAKVSQYMWHLFEELP